MECSVEESEELAELNGMEWNGGQKANRLNSLTETQAVLMI